MLDDPSNITNLLEGAVSALHLDSKTNTTTSSASATSLDALAAMVGSMSPDEVKAFMTTMGR